MLTVVCFRWGDWCAGHDYVGRLYRGVQRHLSQRFRFVCFTDSQEGLPEGVESRWLPIAGWPRNLTKLWMYAPQSGLKGRVLALDLDTVITGSLDDIAAYDGAFCVLEDLWEPGVCGGGVIGFQAEAMSHVYLRAAADLEITRYVSKGGGERHWYRQHADGADFWQRLYPGQIVDAKPEPNKIIDELPPDARLACFHGSPRPHEVERDWLTQHWH